MTRFILLLLLLILNTGAIAVDLAPGSIVLNVDGYGELSVAPGTEPAEVVKTFAMAAVDAGLPMNHDAMQQMLDYFCAPAEALHGHPRVNCTKRSVPPAIELTVEGVGKVSLLPWNEAATVVEAFAMTANEAGFNVGIDGMEQILAYFCARTQCRRGLVGDLALEIEGIAKVVVRPWEEPASAIERFVREEIVCDRWHTRMDLIFVYPPRLFTNRRAGPTSATSRSRTSRPRACGSGSARASGAGGA